MNEHVNNTKYVCWAIETVEPDFITNHRIKNLKVVYKKETTYKDVVTLAIKNMLVRVPFVMAQVRRHMAQVRHTSE